MNGRRREPRYAPDLPVHAAIRAADGSTPVYAAQVLELSGGGLRLSVEAGEALRPDQAVSVRLEHALDEPELVEAVIRRISGENPRVLHLRVDTLTFVEESIAPGM